MNAYNNGVHRGSQRYFLTPQGRKIKLIFPMHGETSLSSRSTQAPGGSVVLYMLGLK